VSIGTATGSRTSILDPAWVCRDQSPLSYQQILPKIYWGGYISLEWWLGREVDVQRLSISFLPSETTFDLSQATDRPPAARLIGSLCPSLLQISCLEGEIKTKLKRKKS